MLEQVWAEQGGIQLKVECCGGNVVLTIFDVDRDFSAKATIADYRWKRIAEMVAHECLRRRYKRLGYHSNSNGEVDFVSPGSWAIEVKWSPVADNLSKTYLRLAIPQKTVWTERNFLLELPQ